MGDKELLYNRKVFLNWVKFIFYFFGMELGKGCRFDYIGIKF